jgi:hypothetical protein
MMSAIPDWANSRAARPRTHNASNMDGDENDPNAMNIDPVATDTLLELSSAASSAASSSAPSTPRRGSRATGQTADGLAE